MNQATLGDLLSKKELETLKGYTFHPGETIASLTVQSLNSMGLILMSTDGDYDFHTNKYVIYIEALKILTKRAKEKNLSIFP